MESEKKLTLSSSDGQLFVVDESAAVQCRTIKNMVEDDCADSVIPLPNVDSATLAMVIEYCKRHADEKASSEDLKVFDWEFVDRDQAVLYDLIMAANYLDAKELLDLLCEKVASMIRGKSVEEIRETFKIKNDFTEEEEKAIREENAWAFN